jgi:hypothetical protein
MDVTSCVSDPFVATDVATWGIHHGLAIGHTYCPPITHQWYLARISSFAGTFMWFMNLGKETAVRPVEVLPSPEPLLPLEGSAAA